MADSLVKQSIEMNTTLQYTIEVWMLCMCMCVCVTIITLIRPSPLFLLINNMSKIVKNQWEKGTWIHYMCLLFGSCHHNTVKKVAFYILSTESLIVYNVVFVIYCRQNIYLGRQAQCYCFWYIFRMAVLQLWDQIQCHI